MSDPARRPQGPLVAQICLHEGSGGAERYLLRLATELASRRPLLVITVEGAWLATASRAADLETVTIRPPRSRLSPLTVARLARVLRSRRARILHSHLGISDWYTWLAARFVSKTALITTEHGISVDRPELFARTSCRRSVHRLAHKLRLKGTDAIIAVSDYTAEALRARYGLRATRIVTTIRPGLDLSSFSRDHRNPTSVREEPLRLVYVGRMELEKGPDLLIEAVRLCASRGSHLVLTMVGDGSLRPRLEAGVQPQKGIEIIWAGRVADPVPLLGNADVFVLPSRTENLPLAVVEAMAAGLPVIATNVGGVSEVVEEGETGLLVDPEDPSALARAIDRCHLDREMLARMGMQGQARSKDFDIHRVAQAISSLYDRVLYELGASVPSEDAP